jgi:peroxiredoxin
LHEKYDSQGFEIIGISLDEDPAKVRAFQNQRNIRWNQALSSSDAGKTKERYRVETIPSTFLIDPRGEVLLIDPNPRDVEDVLVRKLPVTD